MTRLYGIKTCDTCRKALKSMENVGVAVEFRDIRETPLTTDERDRFLRTFGEKLINTRSTTWRALDEGERDARPSELLENHPTLMKRPVIETGEVLTLGWSDEIASQHTSQP